MKPSSSGNLLADATMEIIHKVLCNIVCSYDLQETYVDDADPCMGILAASYFAVQSTYHRTKQKSPGELVFGRDMILQINHI